MLTGHQDVFAISALSQDCARIEYRVPTNSMNKSEWRQVKLDVHLLSESLFDRSGDLNVYSSLPSSPRSTNSPAQVMSGLYELRRLVSAGIHHCDEASKGTFETALIKGLLSLRQSFSTQSNTHKIQLQRALFELLPQGIIEFRAGLTQLEAELIQSEATLSTTGLINDIEAKTKDLLKGARVLIDLAKDPGGLRNLLLSDDSELEKYKDASLFAFAMAPRTISVMAADLVRFHAKRYGTDSASQISRSMHIVTMIKRWDKEFGDRVSKILFPAEEKN